MAAKKRDKRKQKAPYPMQGQLQPPERLCEAGLAYQRDELDTAYALATNVLLATASTPPSQTRVQNLLADICRHQVAGTPSSVRWLELLNSAVARTPRQPHLLFRRVLEYWRSGAGTAAQKYLRAVAAGEPTKPDDALSQVMGRADFKLRPRNSVNPLAPLLADQDVAILDGALATELEHRGADLRDALWSARLLIENPDLIRQLHYDYLVAGADVIITASYQASFEGFARRGIDREQATALLRLSVELAIGARNEFWSNAANRSQRQRPLVAASVGPYGAYLADGSEYRGDYGLTVDELMAWHRPRLAVLAVAGADLLACETLPCLDEGVALARLLPEFPGVSAWLSFSCRDGAHIAHGEPFTAAAALAEQTTQVAAVGVNCTPPRYVESLLRSARAMTTRPLLCYPNSGETWDNANHCWVDSPDTGDFAAAALRWRAAGARLIGGCCRTTPEDIRRLRALLLP